MVAICLKDRDNASTKAWSTMQNLAYENKFDLDDYELVEFWTCFNTESKMSIGLFRKRRSENRKSRIISIVELLAN